MSVDTSSDSEELLLESETPHKCATPACSTMIVPRTGWVPDLATLYEQILGTTVDPRRPLGISDILEMEVCEKTAKDRRWWRQNGITMHPTAKTLEIMNKWWDQKQAREERQTAASAPVKFSLVPRKVPAHGYKAKKKHRERTKKISVYRDPSAPKKFGDEKQRFVQTALPEKTKKKKKKGKGGDDQGDSKKKGGKK
jgi:hypothetical protein